MEAQTTCFWICLIMMSFHVAFFPKKRIDSSPVLKHTYLHVVFTSIQSLFRRNFATLLLTLTNCQEQIPNSKANSHHFEKSQTHHQNMTKTTRTPKTKTTKTRQKKHTHKRKKKNCLKREKYYKTKRNKRSASACGTRFFGARLLSSMKSSPSLKQSTRSAEPVGAGCFL